MSTCQLEPLLTAARRRAVVLVLRAHPEWTLADLFRLRDQDGPGADILRTLTLGELLAELEPAPALPADGGPPIDHARRRRAEGLAGEDFDACVREVIAEAGCLVSASYLRARVGGPRWKLQASLRRLTDAGQIERSGTTSSTRYGIAEDRTPQLVSRSEAA